MAHGRYGALQQAGRAARDHGSDSGESGWSSGGSSGASRSGQAVVSGTGSEPAGAPFWGSAKGMMLTRGYANDNGMNWAPPDLMKMGRPALQVIKESGLQGDGYKALRNPSGLHFGNDSIVANSGYMQRKHLNGNEAAKAGAAVYEHPSMAPADKKDWRSAIDRKRYPAGPAGDEAYAEGIRQSAARGKERHPEMTPEYDRALRAYGAGKDAGLDAKAGANQNEAGAEKAGAAAKKDDASAAQKGVIAEQKSAAADAKDAKADVKEAKTDIKEAKATVSEAKASAKEATNDDASARMAELLKKRQAAAAAPKPPG